VRTPRQTDPVAVDVDVERAFALANDLLDRALEGHWSPQALSEPVTKLAHASHVPARALAHAACRIALRDHRIAGLPPAVGAELVLRLIVALGPAAEVSVWMPSARRPNHLVASDASLRPSEDRWAAATVLAGRRLAPEQPVRGAAIQRWDMVTGALIARGSLSDHGLDAILIEGAHTLSLLLEKQSLQERSAGRERQLVEAAERRLVRLGLDLHDGPLQALVALGTVLQLASRRLKVGAGSTRSAEVLEDVSRRLAHAYENIREISNSAAGAGLAEGRLEDLVAREAAKLAADCDIDVRVVVDGSFDDLTASQRIALARVLQEAFSNVREHSGATTVRIAMARPHAAIRAEITDDGCGFDVERTLARARRTGRLGLVGMSERVRLLGGTLDVESGPGNGARITAILPEWRPIDVAAETQEGATTAQTS
jgi:signal transduction histidine kinase